MPMKYNRDITHRKSDGMGGDTNGDSSGDTDTDSDTCDVEGCDRRAEYRRWSLDGSLEWARCTHCRP
jgi:hypothetical protein